jgi:diguanylate cyclase (GGDEF)-like protein
MAECGRRALPPLGEDLNKRLTEIENGLSRPVPPERIASAAKEVENELSAWAGRAVEQHSESEREMQQIIAALAKAAESVSARDEKYSKEISGMSGNLRGIAAMNDLGAIRRSIIESAAALKTCVEKMAEESRQSVAELTSQVKEYQDRLEASEKLSTTDPLTELSNRRAFESHLESRIRAGKTFGLIMIDLNDFKKINDRHGHLAGDDLLRQFANELRAQFTVADVVARWGGDEFAVLVAGDLEQAKERAERVRRWALGEYKIGLCDGKETRTTLTASMGTVEWNGSENGRGLLARADALVYRTKKVCRAGS